MDFSQIISQAYQMTLRNRVLWIFGAVSAFFGGFPQAINLPFNISYRVPMEERMGKNSQELEATISAISSLDPGLLMGLAIIGTVAILSIIFVVSYFQTWAYAALVSQTLRIIEGKEASFNKGKEVGEKFFWRIVGFRLFLVLILIPIAVILVIFPVMFFIAGLQMYGFLFTIISLFIFIAGLIVYLVAAGIITEFGLRKMIEKNLSVTESVKEGWYLFRENVGPSLLAWLVHVALNFIIVFPFLFIALVALFIGMLFFAINPWLVIIPVIVFLAVLAFVGGIWNTFLFSYWSLVYHSLERK